MATAPDGHVVLAGSFNGTVSFGGSPLVQQGVGNNLYVAVFDCTGQHVWSKRFGTPATQGDVDVEALSVGADGSILLTGLFVGPLDFGTGPLVNVGTEDGYIAKLDAAGNPVFARSFGAPAQYSEGTGAAVDADGNAYLVASAYGQQNFGGGVVGFAGQKNLIVVELDPTGKQVWSNAFGQPEGETRLALDPSGNVLLAGTAPQYAQLNFGGGKLPGAMLYVAKLAPNGSYVWAEAWGNGQGGSADAWGVAAGPTGEVVITGDYQGTIDFGGGMLPTSGGGGCLYVVKLTNAGALVFSNGSAGSSSSSSRGFDVAVNASGEIYLAGGFGGTIDLGGGPVAASSNYDVLFAKLAPTGSLNWLHAFGTAGNQAGTTVALDASATPLLAGFYTSGLDVGYGPLAAEMGNQAGFLARLVP